MKKLRDPVLEFQLRNGFEIIGVLKDYLPHDRDSMGYAAHLIWKNPTYDKSSMRSGGVTPLPVNKVRVATVQYKQRRINSFKEFEKMVTYFVDVVSDYKSDFVVFPELFTMQLLSIENQQIPPHKAIATLSKRAEIMLNSLNFDI